MPALDYPGKDRLITTLDAAITGRPAAAAVAAIQAGLQQLIREHAFTLPDHILRPNPDHYARRSLHASREHGYQLIAMIWGPGQGTPLHDHDGDWCVEGVLQGELEIDEYDLLENDGARFRFRRQRHLRSTAGATTGLLAPQEHHRIRNPDDENVAVSLHVYPRPLTRFHVYTPVPDAPDWHLRSLHETSDD
ncbi:MAG: cysteine dioxygenase family protein [Pseudoxanthomonas sp.]